MQVSRRSLRFFVALGLLTLSVARPAAAAEEKVALRLKPKAGEPYALAVTLDQKIGQTVNGAQQNVAQTMGMTFTFLASKVEPNGTVHGSFTYDAVRVKMSAPGLDVDYDSTKEADGGAAPVAPMAKTFAALVGQKLDVVMTPEGRVTELKGADRILEAMIKAVGLPPGARAGMEQQIKAQFGDEALKRTFETMTAIYPQDPVGVGDTWEVEQRISLGISMVLKTKYTLKSLAGGKATVDARGTIETGAAAGAPAPGQPATDLKGTQQGTLVMDLGSGWLTSGTIKQDIKGTMTLNAGGQQLVIPMTLKSDNKFERVKPKE